MNLKDLKYRIEDDVNNGSIIEIVGFEKGSERSIRSEDETEVMLKYHFLLKIVKGQVKAFRIIEEPKTYRFMLGGSGTDYGWYLDWGSRLHKEIFKYLFTGEGNKIRKNKLYRG
ncbi:MAG: hypothetical protein ACOCRO_01790 [Halanaerobiales bacterium]